MNNDRILIAQIASPHGIKGFVRLNFYGNDIAVLDNPVYVDGTGDKLLTVLVKNKNKNQYIVEIQGITDRNECEKLKGQNLYINKNDASEDETSYLIGLETYDKNGESQGEILSIDNFGASDLLEIKPKGEPSFYIPLIDECVLEIKDDRMIIDLPKII